MRMTLRLALAAALCVLAGAVAMLSAFEVSAQTILPWTHWLYYPARVSAIRFEDRELTAKETVRLGEWTVSFVNRSAFATTIEQNNCRMIEIGELLCSSPKWGTFNNCGILFGMACGRRKARCFLAPGSFIDQPRGWRGSEIECPHKIDFSQW